MQLYELVGPLCVMGASLIVGPAMAGDLYVISNTSLNLSGDEVREVFLGDKQIADGVKLVPIDNTSAQGEFLGKVIKVDATKYSSIWVKKGFRDGLNPPPLKSSDAEVIAAVKATPGAVGYVTSKPAAVKILQKY